MVARRARGQADVDLRCLRDARILALGGWASGWSWRTVGRSIV
jgi:hypothetical protein